MADEQFALSPSVTPPPTEADYEAIFAAVMETMRGRWFLAEYAKRNRHADTDAILAALARVEAAVRAAPSSAPASPAERVRIDLVEMAKAIEHTRSEIASIKPEGDRGSLSEATEELDSIVHTTERATSDILAAAEQVQEIAWTLREHGTDGDSCDALDRRAADIYTACSFQDLTGQRTRKVVDVLRFLEARIKSMIEIWGDAVPGAGAPMNGAVAPQIHDAPGAERLDQPHIDEMMPGAHAPRPTGDDTPIEQAPVHAGEAAIAPAEDGAGTEPGHGAPEAAAGEPEVAECVAERAEPEPTEPEPAELQLVAPEPDEPTNAETAAQPEPAHLASEPLEPEHPAPDHPDGTHLAADLAPDTVEPEHPEPERAAAEPTDSPAPHMADPETVEAAVPSAPEDASAAPPVIVPALAAMGATVFELSPPEIGPVSAEAPSAAPEPEAAPEASRTDPVAILERILAIIHEPPGAPAQPTVADPAPAEPERAALMPSNNIAPVRGAPAIAAVARPDLGVPAPDYSFASDFDIAASVSNATRPPTAAAPPSGITDLPYAHYSEPQPLTVAATIDDMLLDVPLRVDRSQPAVSAPPAAKAAPIEPITAQTPLFMPQPAPLARQAVAPEPLAKAPFIAARDPIAMVALGPEPVAKTETTPGIKAEPAARPEPASLLAPAPAPAPKPPLDPVVPASDTELEWAAEPEPVILSEPVAEIAPKHADRTAPSFATAALAEPPPPQEAARAAPAPAEEPPELASLPVRPAPTAEPPPASPVPAAETPVRVSPVKPAALAMPPEPAAPALHRVAAGAARPRHPGLAAIAALSDDEKIALFS